MRVLLAPDSFKEAASAEAIAQAMARGIMRGNPQAECRLMPLSDGGEGLTQALVHATAGTLHSAETVDAIGRPIIAQFGFLGNKHTSRTAVVELASASGLERVSPADRNALVASTFGTGLLIRAAIDAGADCIVLVWVVVPLRMVARDWLARLDFIFLIRQVMIFRLVAVLLLICRGLMIRKFPIL